VKRISIVFLILCSIHFWGFIQIPPKFYNVTNAFSLLVMGFSFVRIRQKEGLLFKNAIILFLFGLLINIVSAYVNQRQSFLDTFLTMGTTYFFILFYFYLHYIQVNRKFLENIIIAFAIIYSIFYIIQILSYPQVIFQSPVMSEDRGTIRLRIEGNGFLMLGYFLLLNRFIVTRKFINLFLAIGFFFILLLGGFRTLTLIAFLLSGFMLIKLVKHSFMGYMLIVLLSFSVVGLFQFKPTSKIINRMITASIEEKNEGFDNIRLKELAFYFNIYPQNKSVFILGGGLPGSKGSYAQSMEFIGSSYEFYWTDLGLLGFYIIVGVIALFGLLWYTIKAISFKTKQDSQYLNFYFAYLLLVSIPTMEIYRPGIFGIEAIALYLIDLDAVYDRIEE
jgi:hypothetical protein